MKNSVKNKSVYLYYKSNNKIEYDSTIGIPESPKDAILLTCIKCCKTYTDAWKCNKSDCPLYNFKKKWMKRPHTASEWFLKNKHDISKQ